MRMGAELTQLVSTLRHLLPSAPGTAEDATVPLLGTAPSVTPPWAGAASAPSPVSLPDHYVGSLKDCRGFLLQCALYFAHQPSMPDHTRVATVVSRLGGRALEWATAVWENEPHIVSSYNSFTNLFKAVFDHPVQGRGAGDQLLQLRQGTQTTAEYALTFRTKAAASGWNEAALLTAFRNGLRPELQKELACRDDDLSLDSLISLAIRLDHLLRERQRLPEPAPTTLHNRTRDVAESEPMQLGSTRLSAAERRARLAEGRCLYCGELGHTLSVCQSRPSGSSRQRQPSGTPQVTSPPSVAFSNLFCVPVTLSVGNKCLSVLAMIDSGAAGNFIAASTLAQLNVSAQKLPQPLRICTLADKPLGSGRICLQSPVLALSIGSHTENISLFILPQSTHPVVLGLPWLQSHEPTIHWSHRHITFSSSVCSQHLTPVPLASTSIESPPDRPAVEPPAVYRDLLQVFSKTRAKCLPPHRP